MGERSVLDRVIATQPELGPSIPDGGYGWVVVLGSAFFQTLVPSLATAYGIFLLHLKLEHSSFSYPMLWDETMVHTPLLFAASWTMAEPWTRRLISTSTWPRLVGTAGTCLTCAGLLFMWLAINSGGATLALYVLAGILSGIGASICCSQTEILLGQYFRLKLSVVNDLIEAIVAIGFIATPILLGDNIIKHGILRVLVTYQTVILQGVIVCAVFKKPDYLKARRRTYDYISGTADDEEDIYTKDVRELQSRRHQENSNTETSTTEVAVEVTAKPETSNNNIEENQKKWVKFSEDTPTKNTLHESFAQDFNDDLERIDRFENNFVDVPQPLFNDVHVNNNTSYSYEPVVTNNELHQEPTVFVPAPPPSSRRNSVLQNMTYLKQPKFYMALLTIVTTKFSQFIFFTLFPSYLYVRVDSLKIHHATTLVGCLAIVGLCFTALAVWINAHTTKRPVLLWLLCWFGSCGYIMLSNTDSQYFFLVGAATVILSINALQYIGGPLLNLTIRGETNERHRNLSILSACAFSVFLIVDFSYANCFRLMAICQLITGGVWLVNFIYEKLQE